MQSTYFQIPQDATDTKKTDGAAFRNLTGEASLCWNRMGTEMQYGHGVRLFSEGEAPQNVLVLNRGRVKLYVTSQEGKMAIVRIAEAGEILGLSAALSNAEYELSAEALEPCCVTAIRIKDFVSFLEKYPEAAMEATHCILSEYQALFSNVCRLALPATVAGRLANLLLGWQKKRSPSALPNPRVFMALTREEIAGMTGTSRETVSRLLQQFQREKLISIKGAFLTIHKPEALEQLAA